MAEDKVKELEIKVADLTSKLRKHAPQHEVGGNDELRPTQHFRLAGSKLDLAGITYTVPAADGAASTVLTTNGAGVWSWSAAGGLLGAGNWKAIYTNAAGTALGVTLPAADQLLVSGGAAAAPVFKSLLGTTNQLTVTSAAGSLTLSTPQDIHTAASPTFAGLIVPNISPAANFTLTQNAVVPFTSVGAGAVVNTLYLKEGNVGIGTSTFLVQNSLTTSDNMRLQGDRLRIRSSGPGLYFEETDQDASREDYGHWRIIADQNALFFEVWERATPGESEYTQQDEFLSFHRTPTGGANIGEHILQINYPIRGLGARNLSLGANWVNTITPQTARTLNFVTLNAAANADVNALTLTPANAVANIAFPNTGSFAVTSANKEYGRFLTSQASQNNYCSFVTTGASSSVGLQIGLTTAGNMSGIRAADQLLFFTGGTDGSVLDGTAKMVIQSGGNVGIGTPTPTASKLVLNGALSLSADEAPAGTNAYVARINTGDLQLNALTGKVISFAINGTAVGSVSATTLIMPIGSFSTQVTTPTIVEGVLDGGVTIDGVLLKDNLVGHSYLKTESKLVAATRADYTTITSALAAASAGWNIHANGETHNFPSSATPVSQVILKGAGWGHTLALTGNDEMFQTASSVTDFFIRDCYMDGNKATYATNVETAIEMTGAANARIILENLYLKNFDYSAIELSGLDMTLMDKVLVSGMNNTGIDFTGTRSTLVNSWIDAAGMDAGADGVRINGGSSYCTVVNTGISNVGSVGSNRGFVFGGTVTAVSKSLFGFNTAYDWQDLGFIDDGGGGSTFNTLNRIIGCLSFDSKNPAGGGGIGGKYIKGGLYALNIAEKIIDRPGMQFGLDSDDLEGMEINDLMIIANMPTGTHGGIWLDANTKNVTNNTNITANVNGVLIALNRIRDGSYGATYTPQYGLRHLSTETKGGGYSGVMAHNYTDNLWLGNLLTGQTLVGMVFQGTRGLIAGNLVYGINSGDKALTMSAISGSTLVTGNRFWNSALMDVEDLGVANLYGLNLIQKGQFTQYAGLPSSHNEVSNWSFEAWSGGDPVGWTHTGGGAGAAISQHSTAGNFILGSYSLKMYSGTTGGAMETDYAVPHWADFKGKYVTVSCWVKSSNVSAATLKVADGISSLTSTTHTGGGGWELLAITYRVSTSATYLTVACRLEAGAPTPFTAYFDGFMCTKSPFAMEASPDLVTHTHADASQGGGSIALPANGLTVGTTQLVCSGGKVGIGTSGPGTPLHILNSNGAVIRLDSGYGVGVANGLDFSAGATQIGFITMKSDSATNVDMIFSAWKGNAAKEFLRYDADTGKTVFPTTAGTIQMAAYGAGAATFDAAGNISSVSDIRFKDRIAPLPYGLAEVLKLNPIQHGYNALSGLERDHLYGGFSAQEVQTVMPLAVGQDSQGYLTLADRPILGATVNAIKAHDETINALEARIKELEAKDCAHCPWTDTRGD